MYMSASECSRVYWHAYYSDTLEGSADGTCGVEKNDLGYLASYKRKGPHRAGLS